MSKRYNSKNIINYGLCIALVYIATRFINIPGPTEGSLFHLGNVMLFIIAIVFGKKTGAIAGAFGMALFDITSSYVIWAPFTFIIRFCMGYSLGYLSNVKSKNKTFEKVMLFAGLFLSSLIMVVGYYLTEAVLYSNIYIPIESLFGNIMQCVIGIVGALPLSIIIKSAMKKMNMYKSE